MAIRVIRKEDDPILRKNTRKVEKFDDRLRLLAEDMFDTMYDADGCGLAGPQIGILKQIYVVDTEQEPPIVLINPEIVETRGEQCEMEGCLSLPGKSGKVLRPAYVKMRAQDLEGNYFETEGEGLYARALMHEYDHLYGTLFTDKVIKDE